MVIAELCRLDRDLAADPSALDQIENLQVVRVDLFGFRELTDVLPELREDGVNAARLQLNRRRDRILNLLSWHELPDGETHESGAHRALAQPGVGGGPEEELAHQGHGRIIRERARSWAEWRI